MVLIRRDARRLRPRALQHRQRPRDARPLYQERAQAPARTEALGVAVESADLDEIQQTLRGGDARAWATGRDERAEARSGRQGGNRHVYPGGALFPRLRLLLRSLRG